MQARSSGASSRVLRTYPRTGAIFGLVLNGEFGGRSGTSSRAGTILGLRRRVRRQEPDAPPRGNDPDRALSGALAGEIRTPPSPCANVVLRHVLDGKLANESGTSRRAGTILGRALGGLFTGGSGTSSRAYVTLRRVLYGMIACGSRAARACHGVFLLWADTPGVVNSLACWVFYC